jgi:transcriptional regulator with XRE-family HTH domain
MISIQQCRAARGLLGWTQQDLANSAGLSKTAINNFEKGHSDIKAESLKAIRMAFESADVEFIGHDGLRRKSENTRIIKGEDALATLLDDIYETLKIQGGEVLISNFDENAVTPQDAKALRRHRERMEDSGITERALCAEDSGWNGKDYRSFASASAQAAMTTFIYGEKLAVKLWDQSIILMINSSEACSAERRRFENIWTQAQIPASQNNKAANPTRARGA